VINHSAKEYAEGDNHVSAENRHSLLRPYLNIFRGIANQQFANLQRIVAKISKKKTSTNTLNSSNSPSNME